MKYRLVLLPLLALSVTGCNTQKEESKEKKKDNPAISIEDGRCQEIYRFSPLNPSYNPSTSTISRFTVYVESDYDTDLDGKKDLVKAYIQLPRDVLVNNYQVASIFQCSPYTASTLEDDFRPHVASEGFVTDNQIATAQGTSREVTSEINVLEHADSGDKKEFFYTINDHYFYSDSDDCNYFLVRGFAFINVGGYGTYGSEGFNTVGTRLETHSYACVMDWLNGERVAFSNKEGSHTVKATFSNGSYAVQGTSYLGTTAYQLACSNIKGLKTIVPTAGIASWYQYTNSQGTSNLPYTNTPYLSYYCNSKLYEDDLSSSYITNYSQYLHYMSETEIASNGDYTEYWQERDYTKNININCPALIVQGLNDFNVKPRQAVLMYQSFKAANQNVKMIFHQGSHIFLAGGDYAFSIDEYQESFYEVLNRWYSHYLYDVENGIENYPELTYQSNIDGKFYTADNFSEFDNNSIALSNPSRETVTSLGQAYYGQTFKDTNYNVNNENNAVFDLGTLDEDMFIKGVPTLDINLKTTDIGRDNLQVTAILLDTSENDFYAYGPLKFQTDYALNKDHIFKPYKGYSGYYLEFKTNKTKAKVIATSTFDLYNPGVASLSGSLPRVELESNVSYNYKVTFEPTVYTVAKGHNLKLILFTFDPGMLAKDGDFGKVSEYPYNGTENMATPQKWSTTEPYSYTIDMSDGATLYLPN